MSNLISPEETASKKPVALIAGPTASGKSDLAVRLGRLLAKQGRRGVVINADSQQVYGDLRILSARPSEEDMEGIEHRLFGTWDGASACSAADWAQAAKREIAALHDEGSVPILCGGTGLYMRTLLEGIAPIPEIDQDIRSDVRRLSVSELRECIIEEDPIAAERIGERDVQRMSRALEVVRSTGYTLGYWQKRKTGGIGEEIDLHPLVLLPDRDWLYDRCNRRFEIMLNAGAVQEVEALMARGLNPALPVMRAIGVPEIMSFIQGGMDWNAMLDAGKTATRQYAKRQYTWFRHQPPEDWRRADNKSIADCDFFVSLLRD